jgi:hypothetical protein
MQLCKGPLLCFCSRLGILAMHTSMVLLLLMFLSPLPGGAGRWAEIPAGHDGHYVWMKAPPAEAVTPLL